MAAEKARVYKAGVFFDCPKCSKLLRDCSRHNAPKKKACPDCGADARLVAIGGEIVGFASWLRCINCKALLMQRRGEIVKTPPRAGFDTYA